MLLNGCAEVISRCPPLTTYSREFQSRAADELDRLPPQSPVATMVVDYGKLRDACRVKINR